tara:strand:- start:680 stop:1069 length:390 start_codon:yes stop_codon:yes gene_type:complete
MNKSELKEILKPLIKQCIKEVIFEDGVLSGLITEVARGLSNVQPVAAVATKPHKTNGEASQRAKQQLNEVKEQMQKATGLHGVFEGTSALPPQTGGNSQHGPLRDLNPVDPGVNIDGLIKMTGGWNQIK